MPNLDDLLKLPKKGCKSKVMETIELNMKRYLALLRGINISGKNKIPMSELKEGFIKLDFMEVCTLLNSGNVAFSYKETNQIGELLTIRTANTVRKIVDI